eukprot:TRINITY_DN9925_c0_g1_i1.p1 TRINITY_DN9925_c0_g1~~TRINITY_DN9925_c0_g1_i1.p1  ORF type:complete len:409 (-),score=91.77 TRINITY_DN9925_c0_g1_i1:1078-2304(-)
MRSRSSNSLSQEEIEETLKTQRDAQRKRRQQISLLKAPLLTMKYFTFVILGYAKRALDSCRKHQKMFYSSVLVALLSIIMYFTPGVHQQQVQATEAYVLFVLWWVTLGVLSSIGLGTGLHTFVLYLGPHIAKVTLTATECGSLNFATTGENSFLCPPNSTPEEVSVWAVLRKVQVEAFLWGLGTAIGELPPYFVARAARLAGESLKDLEEINEIQESNPSSLGEKLKKIALGLLGRLGFFGILLFASVPNPLFDLAGITCGHFLVPFWTFFGATVIGKAIVKVHFQTIFIILVFSVEHLTALVDLVESSFPFLKGRIKLFLENEKRKLHSAAGVATVSERSVFARIWDMVLLAMLSYFLMSIIDSSVQSYLAKRDEEELAKLEKSLKESEAKEGSGEGKKKSKTKKKQ